MNHFSCSRYANWWTTFATVSIRVAAIDKIQFLLVQHGEAVLTMSKWRKKKNTGKAINGWATNCMFSMLYKPTELKYGQI